MLFTLPSDHICMVTIYPPQRSYKEKKVFPTGTTKFPGHCSNPDLFTRIRARYLLDDVDPDLHRVIYTSIIRVMPVIIEFVAYTEPHDKCFPNQSLFMSGFFFLQMNCRWTSTEPLRISMSCFSLAFHGKLYSINFFKLFASFFSLNFATKIKLSQSNLRYYFLGQLTFRRDTTVRLSGRITFVAS